MKKKEQDQRILDKIVEHQNKKVRRIFFFGLMGLKAGLVLVVILIGWWFFAGRNAAPQEPVSIEITKGQGIRSIARELKKEKAISSEFQFVKLAYLKRKPLQAGLYRIEAGESVDSIYNKIASGLVFEDTVTIPEGWRREQIAQLLSKKGLVDYEVFMAVSEGKEGHLFPDTYRIPKKTTAEAVVALMEKNYTTRVASLGITEDQLKIAAIVEREAKKDEDRPKIASVFLNRLAKKMKLEADPTVQYALDDKKLESVTNTDIKTFTFWTALKPGETKSTISPYNTYQVASLPPGPICNPGLKSINAVLHPEQTNYLFFINTADGSTYYGENLQQHNENKIKYNIGVN